MNKEDIEKIIDMHRLWLFESAGRRADLSDANLSGADLSGAILSGANLRRAILSGANLRGADLIDANLSDANLRRANLRGANLRGAILRGADLRGAILSDADLSGADLSDANLSDANLRGADLRGANLRRASLSDANLRGATLPHISTFPIDLEMARVIEQSPDLFNMSEWHSSCGTTHCRAGWAVNLHPTGLTLESIYGTSAAAGMIYAKCSVLAKVPDWHASNEDAIEDIRERAKQAAEATP